MSDVNTFVETVGRDITAVAVPRIEALAAGITATTLNEYGPRVSAFASELIQEIIREQSAGVRDFVTSLVQELCQRYRPELQGEVHARLAEGGINLSGRGVKLELKRRDTGAVVASLDLPIDLHIKVQDLAVTVREATIALDVVR